MIRLILRSLAINIASVYLTIQILSGIITYVGGLETLILAAVLISVANLLVKPLINLFLLPIHLLTLGLSRWLANLLTLYLVTLFIPSLSVHSFTSQKLDLMYLIVPPIHFSAFGAFIVATLTLTAVFHFLYWLFQD
jgi:putative membrane protein